MYWDLYIHTGQWICTGHFKMGLSNVCSSGSPGRHPPSSSDIDHSSISNIGTTNRNSNSIHTSNSNSNTNIITRNCGLTDCYPVATSRDPSSRSPGRHPPSASDIDHNSIRNIGTTNRNSNSMHNSNSNSNTSNNNSNSNTNTASMVIILVILIVTLRLLVQ